MGERNLFIFSGGTIDDGAVKRVYDMVRPDIVIAADRGLFFCDRSGIVPDLIAGDFDSLGVYDNIPVHASYPGKEETAADNSGSGEEGRGLLEKYGKLGIDIERTNVEKDMSDTETAIEEAAGFEADEVWIFGGTGTRMDHSMNNVFNLKRLAERGITGHIADRCNYITVPSSKKYVIEKEKQYGSYVSLLPFDGAVTGLTLRGFKYPLEDASVAPDDGGLCISNEITADAGEISWKSGSLIIMETRD